MKKNLKKYNYIKNHDTIIIHGNKKYARTLHMQKGCDISYEWDGIAFPIIKKYKLKYGHFIFVNEYNHLILFLDGEINDYLKFGATEEIINKTYHELIEFQKVCDEITSKLKGVECEKYIEKTLF